MSILEISKEEIIGWLIEHKQAWEDFCNHFKFDEADTWNNIDDESMITRQGYYESVAECFLQAYVDLSRNVHKINETEYDANIHVSDEINEIFPCCGDEQAYLYNSDLQKAYDAFREHVDAAKAQATKGTGRTMEDLSPCELFDNSR